MEPLDHCVDQRRDLARCSGDGRWNSRILPIHQLEELLRGTEVEVAPVLADRLGNQVVLSHAGGSVRIRGLAGQYQLCVESQRWSCRATLNALRSPEETVARIELEHVVKVFPGGVAAVDDVSLEIADG